MVLYHVLNRGVDKREICLDNSDRARFVHNLFEFNSTAHAINNDRLFINSPSQMRDVGRLSSESSAEKLVEIHGWCLMGNHYHLLLSELREGGLSLFLKKLNGGYAKYFNERYLRGGALFQGKTKRILIDSDAHFLHILNYIHLNPLDRFENSRKWREGKITATHSEVFEYLKEYRWSSYLDYVGTRNFPSILTTALFQEVFNDDYTAEIKRSIMSMSSESLRHLFLEGGDE